MRQKKKDCDRKRKNEAVKERMRQKKKDCDRKRKNEAGKERPRQKERREPVLRSRPRAPLSRAVHHCTESPFCV